jgi:tetratricopeptide (TPR) repeat protein
MNRNALRAIILLGGLLATARAQATAPSAAFQDPAEAIKFYNKGLELRDAGKLQGYQLMSLGRNNEAEEVLRQSLALNPEDKDVRDTLKSATDRQAFTPELAKLQNKVRSNPHDAEAWGRFAGALYNAGRHEDAIAALREAVRLMVFEK